MLMLDVIFVIVAGLLSIALLLARTNMAMAIMGLCAGYVFSDIFTVRLSGFLYENNYAVGDIPVNSIVSIALILLPALLIILRFRHYQKNRAIQHVIPVFAFVVLTTVLVINNIPANNLSDLVKGSIFIEFISRYELYIVAGVIVLAVLDIMIFESGRKRQVKRLKKRGKKRHQS